jgi:hypothetical protein
LHYEHQLFILQAMKFHRLPLPSSPRFVSPG